MSPGEPPGHYIVDASVVAKWQSGAEADRDVALQLREQFLTGTLRLSAPEYMMVEVIRVLQLGVRDRRYTATEGLGLLRGLLRLPILYIANQHLFEPAFLLSSDYQMAFYDALYLAASRLLDVPLITADRRFYNLSQNRGLSDVRWLADEGSSG